MTQMCAVLGISDIARNGLAAYGRLRAIGRRRLLSAEQWWSRPRFSVVGSTGGLGGRVVRLSSGRGEEVRCLVRPQTDDSTLSSLGVDIVRGDLTDAASLRSACAGVDTAVLTATAIGRLLSGAGGSSIQEVDEDGGAALVGAAESAGAGRFVYVSFAGADAGLGYRSNGRRSRSRSG
jgi:uncharacterized protein YbjT (DUF2867 family)